MESEYEKERALFDQKVDFLERSLAEKADRERSYMSELHTKRSELTGELRAACQKYEGEIRQLQGDLEDERERVSEMENLIMQKNAEIEGERVRWVQQEGSLKAMVSAA